MIDYNANVIEPGELALKYSVYWRTWSRVLFMDKDQTTFVEVNLTPVNPDNARNWVDQVYPIMIRVHNTRIEAGDRIYRHVLKLQTSLVYQELKKAMLRHVVIELMFRLLNEDFLDNINWDKYRAVFATPSYRGAGAPYALIKDKP